MKVIEIWTDGGVRKRKQLGSWAFCIYTVGMEDEHIPKFSGLLHKATSQQSELTACIKGLQFIKDFLADDLDTYLIKVYSDSQYLVKGMNEWLAGWKFSNWRKSDNKPVSNKPYWLELDKLKRTIPNLEMHWVKGHSGVALNELVDGLCQEELEQALKNDKINEEANDSGRVG